MDTYEMKCRSGMEMDLDACTCSKGVRSFDLKCRDNFEMAADSCSCNFVGDFCDMKIKCPYGQGWDQDTCACGFWTDCTAEPACDEETEYQNKMTCECMVKGEGKLAKTGDKSGDKTGNKTGDKSGKPSAK